jgi:hypothetical protein
LTGVELKQQLLALDTADGVEEGLIWHLFDACDCGRWFTKRALHEEHRFSCPYWDDIEPVYVQDQEILSVLNSGKASTSTTKVVSPKASTSATKVASPKASASTPPNIPYPTMPHPSPASPLPTASPATKVGAQSLLALSQPPRTRALHSVILTRLEQLSGANLSTEPSASHSISLAPNLSGGTTSTSSQEYFDNNLDEDELATVMQMFDEETVGHSAPQFYFKIFVCLMHYIGS